MQTHVRVLGILHLAFGALGVLTAIFLSVLFGGITSLIGMNATGDDARIAIPILGGIGTLIVLVTVALSIPSLIAGWGLLSYRPWARILTIILSIVLLVHLPLGTALGFYGFWVLLSREGTDLFQRRSMYDYPRV